MLSNAFKFSISLVVLIQSNIVQVTQALRTPEAIERLYVVSLFRANVYWMKDKICDYPPSKKLRLCESVFAELSREAEYSDLHVNYGAFAEQEPKCTTHSLTFAAVDEYADYDARQRMLPCYGAHDPLRTDVTVDDYYDVFYVSSGAAPPDSTMVYKRVKTADADWFTPLEQYTIKSPYELDEAHNDNKKEVEIIYIREVIARGEEKLRLDSRSFLAELAEQQFVNLCLKLFGHPKYKNQGFLLDVPRTRQHTRDTTSVEQLLVFAQNPKYNQLRFKRSMHPCFVRNANAEASPREDEQPTQYQISDGSRHLSVVIHELTTIGEYSGYRPVELVENINVESLYEHVDITD